MLVPAASLRLHAYLTLNPLRLRLQAYLGTLNIPLSRSSLRLHAYLRSRFSLRLHAYLRFRPPLRLHAYLRVLFGRLHT